MGRLQGKVAFITGAGAGIAKASALAFIREGAKVALAEINPASGRATEKQARNAAARKLFPFSVAESEDMAAIAVFLASDESRAVTGVVIPADGGRSACFKLYVPEV